MSFYYKIDPNSFADNSLIQWLTAQGTTQMHASGFYQSERKAAEHLRAPEFWSGLVTGQSTASLRIFSGSITLQQVFDLLQLLPADATYSLSLYRPHADLALAVRIDLPQALSADQILALRQLSEPWAAELVYLVGRRHDWGDDFFTSGFYVVCQTPPFMARPLADCRFTFVGLYSFGGGVVCVGAFST